MRSKVRRKARKRGGEDWDQKRKGMTKITDLKMYLHFFKSN